MSDIVAFHKIVPRFYSAKEKCQKKRRPFARAFGFPIAKPSAAAGQKLVPPVAGLKQFGPVSAARPLRSARSKWGETKRQQAFF
jgi:hypothetical protein